jgi:hypothetical protein
VKLTYRDTETKQYRWGHRDKYYRRDRDKKDKEIQKISKVQIEKRPAERETELWGETWKTEKDKKVERQSEIER